MGSSGGGIIFPLRTWSSSFVSRALLSGFWVSGGGTRDDDCHIMTGWISVSPTGNIKKNSILEPKEKIFISHNMYGSSG
jgi:hypothetical protein